MLENYSTEELKREIQRREAENKPNKKQLVAYNKEALKKIGSNVASIYGGECYYFRGDNHAQKMIFFCIKNNKRYEIAIEFIDLYKYYC